MKLAKTTLVAMFLTVVAAAASTQTPSRRAAVGEGATGEVVKEANEELQIDTTPCGSSRTIVIFRQPYTKEAAGNLNCGGTVKQLVQAVQN